MSMSRRYTRFALSAALLVASTPCASPVASPPPVTAAKPTLIVFITVDQMRPDYLERFKSQLHGGLARLVNGGAYFTDGHQDHAITETAPGHASTMSGRFPRSTGITRNLAGVNDRNAPLIGARDLGASPFRFRGTTLTDWMTSADPATRALSVSSKDRAAILPIGRSKQQVFWYANNGIFTTSSWYADTLPTWVTRFNARHLPQKYAGKAWTPLLEASAYTEVDSILYESDRKNVAFPHTFPDDSAAAAAQVRYTPIIDELTAAVALEGVRTMNLGGGSTTDLLAVSFSATDYVGHFFGPESKEQHDQILRLDRVLGAFLDTLFTLRDPARVIIALTADHGGGFIPELHGGLRVDIDPAMAAARDVIRKAGGDTLAVDFESGAFFLDRARAGTKVAADEVLKAFTETARTIPGVLRIDRFADLGRQDTTRDYIARRWLQMFPDDLVPEAVVTLKEGDIYNWPIVATHGSPHNYDSHVPILFYGSPFKPGRYSGFVRTVDLGPTLAKVLGVSPTERLDGRILTEAIR